MPHLFFSCEVSPGERHVSTKTQRRILEPARLQQPQRGLNREIRLALDGHVQSTARAPPTQDAVRIFENLWERLPASVSKILAVSLKVVSGELLKQQEPCAVERNIAFLGELLDLDMDERAVLLLATMCQHSSDLSRLFSDIAVSDRAEGLLLLARLANVDDSKVRHILSGNGRLVQMQILQNRGFAHSLNDLLEFDDRFKVVLLTPHDSLDALVREFLKPSAPGHLGAADYPHLEADRDYLAGLLKGATQHARPGVNILLYGPPGTGKTQFAKYLAQAAGTSLYDVESANAEGLSDTASARMAFLFMSQRFLKTQSNCVLLFDEAEDAFPQPNESHFFSFGKKTGRAVTTQNKAWINQFLETNAAPVIWISNHIDQIDPAYLRRFTYHLEINVPPKSVRRAIAHKHLAGLGVSEEVVHALAEPAHVSPAQIEVAARGALLTADANVARREDFLRRQIRFGCRAMGMPEPRFSRIESTTYDTAYLNLNAAYPIEKIISSLRQHREGKLCFYGRSGTGKTALGRHIASALDRELIVKSASDVLSMWVGGTEKNIAAMFREAEDAGAVLLLDEADTLMRDRSRAEKSWEASQVNEFLARMEAYSGIFICTTNLFRDLDQALLRRFTFKIEFLAMTPEQRARMLAVEFAESVPENDARHRALDGLTPGDVANVKRQVTLMDAPASSSALVDLLISEISVREGEGARRHIGFV